MEGKVLLILATVLSVALSSPPLSIEQPPRFYDLQSKAISAGEVTPDALLPASLDPQSYTINLQPILYNEGDLKEWTAPGSVLIQGIAVAAVNRIVLNRHESLTVARESVEVRDQNNAIITVTSVEDPSNAPTYTLNLAQSLVVGQTYTIYMKFVASIRAATSGLYRAYYTNEANEQIRIAVTQFESKAARQAFPCFDEPSFNSKFTISLARPNNTGYNTLCNSNQRVTGQAGQPGDDVQIPSTWVWDIYEETVKMPTYLVAIVISDFEYEEAPVGLFDKPVKIYGPRGQIKTRDGGSFAAEASAKVMQKLEDIFDHKYEMPKVDSVSVPRNYFGAGAMENWGLITYRDNYLMYYMGESIESEKQQIASVIVHEQAHQWFGNLVTCKYWAHIWLNEGFATYVAQLGLNEVYPEFEERREFLYDSVQGSMAYDIGPNQPILNLQNGVDEQSSSSTIIYDKGGSIIRMMEGFLGYDALVNALQKYLAKYAYQSAEQDNLFETLQEYVKDKIPADKTMKEIMDTWTLQPGYPVIRVDKDGANRVNISQKRFLPAGETSPTDELWEVPIPIATPDTVFANYTPALWLDTITTSYSHDTSKWIVLNPDSYGYYRVLYDDDLLKLIQDQLNADKTKIGGLSRSQLVDDYFAFALQGHAPITKALDMTTSLQGETDFVVWYSVFRGLNKALQMFSNQDTTVLKDYLVPKLDAALEDVNWHQGETETGTKVIYRSRLADWACAVESPGCTLRGQVLLALWIGDPTRNPVALDLQPVLYCSIVAHGGSMGFEQILKEFNKPDTSLFQKARLVNSLGCTKDNSTLNTLLDFALDPINPVSQYTVSVLQKVAGNSALRQEIFRRIRTNETFNQLKTATGGVNAFSSIVSTLSTYLNKDTELQDLQTFVEEKRDELASVMNSINSSMNNIRNNIAWVTKNYAVMNSWLQQHKP